ncbi:MAG: hypothetical protein NVSMB24_12830 [Mucilaginibacter sp.]
MAYTAAFKSIMAMYVKPLLVMSKIEQALAGYSSLSNKCLFFICYAIFIGFLCSFVKNNPLL